MSMDRKIEYINHFSSFWKGLTNSDGTINSNYGNLLFGEQIIWAHEALVKDINSRQAISFVSRPDFQYEDNKDFVCTVYLNFWIRKNKLHMKVQMRSNDLFYGYSYDVPFFAAIQQTMWHNLCKTYPELQLGAYYHCADNMHYYERHFELADSILNKANEDNDENIFEPPMFFYMKYPLFHIHTDCIEYSKEAMKFKEDMDNIIKSGDINYDNCKKSLQQLFNIQ